MISALVQRPATPAQIAGAGSAVRLAQAFRSTRTVLVADPALSDRLEILDPGGFLWVEDAGLPAGIETASKLARRLDQSGVERLLAVGGGNTMDVAKLAVAMASDPSVEPFLRRIGDRNGVAILPRPLAGHIEFGVIPSTFGTGSEVNAGACYESPRSDDGDPWPDRAKNLVLLEGLSTSMVAYDPGFLEAPPWLAAEGLLEPAVRLLTSMVEGGSALGYSEAQGRWLLGAAGANLRAGTESGFRLSSQQRLDAALLSAESHAGWSLRGRGPAPSSLWFLANELSMALGIRKNQASILLLGPWLAAVAGGNTVWGDGQKLEELWPLVANGVARAASVARLGPDHALGSGGRLSEGKRPGSDASGKGTSGGGSLVPADLVPPSPIQSDLADALARNTLRRFGRGRPMKKELAREQLSEMFAAGIRAAGLTDLRIDPYGS
ncbi:iron-containing alcohol dehydrogenase [Arthrobacter sp. fls2-241-R2A-200]|uniref:iron-containing alcohol dehydrogenase n=1 Tax=Arthrobacter sp. fls2-241-R2A-200 TaxID=3040281 RepID=UPI00254D428F|nr:iron-containing alcohol dehydrogenase [Arthrobacter sp. fls2-241-R2A-200]